MSRKALFIEHRPSDWPELVGHDKLKRSIAAMRLRGSLGGRAFWISGASGIGKTSCAGLIAGEVCDADNFVEVDAGELTPKAIDDLERMLRCRAIGDKSGRAVLTNESHGLRKDSVRKLLVVLERIPAHVTWVFTTTSEGQQALFDGVDSHPLLSRCIKFELKVEDCAAQIVERAKAIAEAEGLGGADLAEYMLLAKRCKFNFRDMLTEIERGEMFVALAPQIVTARFGDGQSYDSAAIERMLMRS